MSQFQDAFREEAQELLIELEEAFLELEQTPTDMDIVGRIFRAMHTIKGSGAMFGFEHIARFTHELETVFDRVRNGELQVAKELIEIGLAAESHIKDLLQEGDTLSPDIALQGKAILRRLSAFSPPVTTSQKNPKTSPPKKEANHLVTWRIRFIPNSDILANGTQPLLLLRELQELGDCHVIAHTSHIPLLDQIDPERCYVSWDILLTTEHPKEDIQTVFLFVEDQCELTIEAIDTDEIDAGEAYKRLGEILVERGDLTAEQSAQIFSQKKLSGQLLEEQGLVAEEKIQSALKEQEIVREGRLKRAQTQATQSIRVSAEKLDAQMDLVGELVIAQAGLNQLVHERNDMALTGIAESLNQLIMEIRDNVLNIRMLPIGSTFSGFRRLVRDLSAEQGKEIELLTEGAETELDKTVIEQLGDPLVHLIRNSADHGIETPAVRLQQGKPAKGIIQLTAKHAQGHVIIEIKDDGKGLDPEAIRSKAIEKGLLVPGTHPSNKELYNFIFAPGFSTAKQVTNISGRGVGMDVVKRAIDNLRGTIDIDSTVGEGTTIRLRLPLTLAIIEGLLVRVANDTLVIPLAIVEECIEITPKDRQQAHGRPLARVRGELVPCIPLREWAEIAGPAPDLEQVVIVALENERYGFMVDDVIGQHQIVIKNLGDVYKDVEGVAGATILGNGKVALILDVQEIGRLFAAQELLETASHE